jgi:two-component system sensor histidine kinase RegB
MPTSNASFLNATRLNMQRLIMLRGVIMLALGLVILSLRQAAVPLPVLPLSLAIAALGLFSLIAWWRLQHTAQTHQAISQLELLLQLLGDVLALSVLFYFSGGYSNPFIWMYLLPITVAAVALRAGYAWLIASLCIVCYTLLMFYHVPLSHLHLHAQWADQDSVQLDIHLLGMWIGFVVSTVIVAIFIARIGQNLRDYDQAIASVREQALESERMLALGTLATSAAHELGTPLATMAVVAKELMQDYASQPELLQQLSLMQKQIARCKEILSSITRNAGLARAEASAGLPLEAFINEALQRWRDTRPATELVVCMPQGTPSPQVSMDRTLSQALLNLLDNAADESPARILFDAQWTDKLLTLHIRDFGPGLSLEAKQKIGTPFFSSKQADGMGLGLYLTHTTLARYDGELSFNNHAEGGVLTTVKLPLAKLKVSA